MTIDDIDELVDAMRIYRRAHRRVAGEDANTTVRVPSMSRLREIASLTDRSIDREPLGGRAVAFSLVYYGTAFEHIACCSEVG